MQFRAFRFLLPSLAVAAIVSACGGESTGPAGQLDAAATRQTVQQLDQSFSAPSVRAFEGASPAIDQALGGGLAVASAFMSPEAARTGTKLQRVGQRQLAILNGGTGATAVSGTANASIPTIALGRTFEWNTSLNRYALATTVPTDLPAVPANAVRFLLYTWDSTANRPVTPLNRIGYAQLTETTSGAGRVYRLVVIANGTTFLDYSAGYAFSAGQSATLTVEGFVTNGTDRANFTLANSVLATNNTTAVFDYDVTVPSRDITLDYLVTLRNLSAPLGDEQLAVDLRLQGNNNRVDLDGTLSVAQGGSIATDGDDLFEGVNGTVTVQVNGGTFATITFAGNADPVFRNAAGQPLTADEADALEDVFDLLEDGFDFIEDLLDPVDHLFD